MRLKLTWIVMTLGLSFVSAPAHAVNCGAVTVLNNLKTFAGEFRNFSGTYRVELVQMPDWRTVSCDALFGGGTSFKAAQLCTFRVTDTRTGRVTQTAPVTEVYMRASANTSYFTFDVPSLDASLKFQLDLTNTVSSAYYLVDHEVGVNDVDSRDRVFDPKATRW